LTDIVRDRFTLAGHRLHVILQIIMLRRCSKWRVVLAIDSLAGRRSPYFTRTTKLMD